MSYNGHPSQRLWNLALWMGNDEGLYRLAKEAIRGTRNRKQAAERFVSALAEAGITETPDGYRWTVSGAQHAMRGL